MATTERLANKRAGYTIIELVFCMMLVLIGLALMVPNGQGTKKSLQSKMAAEELISRLRRARQSAIAKGVPVAVAIPTNASTPYSDTAYELEGDVNPKASQIWTIDQETYDTVLYVGQWNGPNWQASNTTRIKTISEDFDPNAWWDGKTPPSAAIYVFTPAGNLVSTQQTGDGLFRIVVAQGVIAGGNKLTQADAAWTISMSQSGDCDLEKGIYKGLGITPGFSSRTAEGAKYVAEAPSANAAPTLISLKAFPDTENPNKKKDRVIDINNVLTLEVRVRDADGHPPYFKWSTAGAIDAKEVEYSDLDRWGGRFSNSGETRMEWDLAKKEWVGRASWSPAPEDDGGNGYKLQCSIVDREGGELKVGFPVTGGYLRTLKENWVLYRTIGTTGRWEAWKMTLEGLEHTRLVAFPNQDVQFAKWSPAGDEVIVGAGDGVYRALNDGSALRKVSQVNLGGTDGCAISPSGDAMYYIGGGRENKTLHRVSLSGVGNENDTVITNYGSIDWTYDLSCARVNGTTLLVHTYYRKFQESIGGLWRTRHRFGIMAVNGETGARTDDDYGPLKNRAQNRGNKYGVNITSTGDFLLYGTGGSVINVAAVAAGSVPNINAGPPMGLDTRRGGVHDPDFTPDNKGIVFVSGSGAGARVYYMPDKGNPGNNVVLPLADGQTTSDNPSVSLPH